MPRYLALAICAVSLYGIAAACGNGGDQSGSRSPEQPADPPPLVAAPAVAERPGAPGPPGAAPVNSQEQSTSGAAAGVAWTVPPRWEVQPPRTMRMATYLIPKDAEDDEPGECAVFYFGRGQGGSVDLNLQRWREQFETDTGGQPSLAERKSTINGLAVTTVSLAGTYLASMGPMFQSGAVKKPGYRMLGAIIEAPEGNVFVKLTGPENTVLSAESEFQAFLNSLRK
ncbi:MAG: hypothetical protein F4Z81_05665 [Gemmatimonadetes bacterium]|nr:hypothetical protein [Gemmatimonadota bacterium]MYB62081.1 hypothetical protein [Gemmatimonadota bacterium]